MRNVTYRLQIFFSNEYDAENKLILVAFLTQSQEKVLGNNEKGLNLFSPSLMTSSMQSVKDALTRNNEVASLSKKLSWNEPIFFEQSNSISCWAFIVSEQT